MKVEQLYTACLAQGAYFIESNGEAAVIDPLREVEPYLEMARERNATIRYIFETHFHADFVSGHKDLAAQTGATIVYGPTSMETGFKAHIAHDGEKFQLGDVHIQLLHTPGHTLESSCYLLTDEEDEKIALFTGDTLFIGDVGRPDLAQKVIADLTPEKLGSMLYHSLREKIMPLPDDIIIYPGHGAGSACGKNMSAETSDTLGNQKRTNYALNTALSEADFLKELLHGLTPPPGYFPKNVLMNIQGYTSFDEVMTKGNTPLSPEEFNKVKAATGALIVETRHQKEFEKAFIPGAINISLDGNFAVWAGTLIPDIHQKILLVAEPGRVKEAIKRLSRVGYDHTIGYLDGNINDWKNAGFSVDFIEAIEADALADLAKAEGITILDVRKKSEYDSEHVVGAINLPLDYIRENNGNLDKKVKYYVHCASGYRSTTFISIMKTQGYNNLVNVDGGIKAIKALGKMELTEYVCPTTLL